MGRICPLLRGRKGTTYTVCSAPNRQIWQVFTRFFRFFRLAHRHISGRRMLFTHEKTAMCSSVLSECPAHGLPLCNRPAASGVCCTCVVVELGSLGEEAGGTARNSTWSSRCFCSTASGAGGHGWHYEKIHCRSSVHRRRVAVLHTTRGVLVVSEDNAESEREDGRSPNKKKTLGEREGTSQTRTDSLSTAGQSACVKPSTPEKNARQDALLRSWRATQHV